jgi:two-component system OmpR family sensor kinase
MKLQVKLSVLIGIVFTSGSLIINGSNSIISKREAIRTQDKILKDALDLVRESPTKDVSEVLVFSETSPAPISATLYSDDSEPVVLIEGIDGSRELKIPNLEISKVASATKSPLSLNDQNSMRISSYSIGNGEWLIVGLSIASVNQEFSNSIGRSLLLTVTIALLMTLLVRFLVSRALRPIDLIIEDAKNIAAGSTEIKLRTAIGNDEISRLTQTLDEMLDRIQKAVKTAKDSENLMKEFMDDASHELRSPLTVIRGYVDILAGQQALSDEQRERAIYRLKSESLRMSKTIDDLLTLAEIGEVKIRQSDEVNLSDLVTEFVEDFKSRNPSRSVHQNIDSKVTVSGNSEQLSRMIANLISNIERHTPELAAVEVLLVKSQTEANLFFDDAGAGLTADTYSRLNTGFQRFDKSRSKSGGGFGLGLSIMSAIVKNHGGTVRLSPSHLGGLRTQISLPTSTSKN